MSHQVLAHTHNTQYRGLTTTRPVHAARISTGTLTRERGKHECNKREWGPLPGDTFSSYVHVESQDKRKL